MKRKSKRKTSILETHTHAFAKWTGSSSALIIAAASIVLWLASGLYYDFSQSWENYLTAYVGIITYLFIFIMQRSQLKELSAVHVKLDELIASTQNADNAVIAIEEGTEEKILRRHKVHRGRRVRSKTKNRTKKFYAP